MIGETILSLIDPAFLKVTPTPSIYRYFGLPISEKELESPQIQSVNAIRTNGETFVLKVSVVLTEDNIITAKLSDENDSLSESSHSSCRIERLYSSVSTMQSSYGNTSFYGGIAVDMKTMNASYGRWRDAGHYDEGMEETNDDQDPTMGAISLAISFLSIPAGILHDTLLIHYVVL